MQPHYVIFLNLCPNVCSEHGSKHWSQFGLFCAFELGSSEELGALEVLQFIDWLVKHIFKAEYYIIVMHDLILTKYWKKIENWENFQHEKIKIVHHLNKMQVCCWFRRWSSQAHLLKYVVCGESDRSFSRSFSLSQYNFECLVPHTVRWKFYLIHMNSNELAD